MAYSVPDLPYDYNALEPHIDEATMRLHHDKHHQAYVDKVNAALEGTEWADKPIEEVLKNLDKLGDKKTPVRNNGGGHYNHSLFWEWMSPDGGGEPSRRPRRRDRLGVRLVLGFQEEMKDAGVNRFGSGWAWLVHDGSGLAVVSTPNQDNPDLRRPDAAAGRRRVGARLLPEVPEQAPRLHRRVVERRELAEGRRGLRGLAASSGRGRTSRAAAQSRRAARPSANGPAPATSATGMPYSRWYSLAAAGFTSRSSLPKITSRGTFTDRRSRSRCPSST